MGIAFYDIDLWHRGKAMPNLELMKMYNYHHNIKKERVIMLRPKDSTSRFNKIVYFKENPRIQLPQSLVIQPNSELIGYGFFNGFYPIDDIYHSVRPSYDCYDLFEEKFTKSTYRMIKNSSYIRVENQDFSDFDKNKNYITIADYNFLNTNNAIDFFEEYKNYTILFRHENYLKDEKVFNAFTKYFHRINQLIQIDYPFSKENLDNIIKNKYKVAYNLPVRPHDSDEKYLVRIINIFLYYKMNNNHNFKVYLWSQDIFLKYILEWGTKSTNDSYYEYYNENKEAISLAETAPSSVRVLLKSNPQRMNSSSFDFSTLL